MAFACGVMEAMVQHRTRLVELHLRHTFRIARGASDLRRNVVLELEEDGTLGLGEAAPLVRYGQTAEGAVEAIAAMAGRLTSTRAFATGPAAVAVPGQAAAAAAVDIACHDLAGRRLGVPVHELLGLSPQPAPETSLTIGMDTPDVVVAKVREAADYPVLKIKLGGADDRAVLEAVRDTTRQRLRVDANEGWTPEVARERLTWLARLGVEMVEQPLPASMVAEMRELRRHSPLPLWADESVHRAQDVPALAGAFDGVNVKLMKCGGIAEALRVVAVARAHGMGVMLGCMIETSIGISAAAALGSLVDTADLDGNLLITDDPYEGATVRGGRVVPADRPGLGLVPRTAYS